MTEIHQRIQKNYSKLLPWSERHNITAFRLYDRDIPSYPFIVDLYNDYTILYDRREEMDFQSQRLGRFEEIQTAILQGLGRDAQKLILKVRQRQQEGSQYNRVSDLGKQIKVQETQARFWINLTDYLDTGLFLDHRLTRQMIFKLAKGRHFLNLFSYTSSASVFAALGSAKSTTSVDLSNTYLNWSQENFALNGILTSDVPTPSSPHAFVNADTMTFLQNDNGIYDLIFLDPPTFSKSKKFEGTFDIQRDHKELIELTVAKLSKQGTLLFSTNRRDFRLDLEGLKKLSVIDITAKSIPKDFHDGKIHKLFQIQKT